MLNWVVPVVAFSNPWRVCLQLDPASTSPVSIRSPVLSAMHAIRPLNHLVRPLARSRSDYALLLILSEICIWPESRAMGDVDPVILTEVGFGGLLDCIRLRAFHRHETAIQDRGQLLLGGCGAGADQNGSRQSSRDVHMEMRLGAPLVVTFILFLPRHL